MNKLMRAALAASGLFTIAFSTTVPATAADAATVTFRCASSDAGCDVEVRLGSLDSPDRAIPYSTRHLDKGGTWDVDSGGLYVFYKAKDGSWQRLSGNRDAKVDV